MADNYGPTFGGYAAPTGPITAPIQAEIIVEINKLKALIPDITADPPVSATTPDFDRIHPRTAEQLRAEIDALIVAIDATPTS